MTLHHPTPPLRSAVGQNPRRWPQVLGLLLAVTLLISGVIAPARAFAQDATATATATGVEAAAVASPTGEAAAIAASDVVSSTTVRMPDGTLNTTITFVASQDAYLSSAFPNTNFGGTQNLNVGWQQGGQEAMRMLMQWDVNSIPRNAVINWANYQIFQTQWFPTNDGNMDFRAQYMRQAWNESGVTWNNANFLGGDALPLGSIPPTFGWQQGSATTVVSAWVSGQMPNFGLLITGDETPSRGRWRIFSSRETSNSPRLQVNYTVNCDNVPPTASIIPLPNFSPGSFEVSWTGQDFAPSGCAPTGIANFDVDYSINGGSWVSWQSRTTRTSATFNGFAPNGANVQFRVRATDRAGNRGNLSPTVSTVVDTVPPTATMNPLALVQGTSSFLVTWTGSDNLSGIRSYDVEFRIDEGSWEALVSNTQATAFTVTGATSGQKWEFRARATDNVGNVGPWPSDPQAFTYVLTVPVVVMDPIVPSVINSTSPVTDSIALSWRSFTPPGTTITEFRVFYNYNNQGRVQWQTFGGSVSSVLFPWKQLGLGDGIYEFDVIARNSAGNETPIDTPIGDLGRASAIVDLADTIAPREFLPAVYEMYQQK
ncbi:MAG: fibronectin type III domain-containing protein [Anaerolineales bacterium]|nr:fibronectin type III domain-containing protein [Anaerolineales bacterium]